jgi:hypothetical protein
MALIEINIPEQEGWQDNLAARVIFALLAAMLMQFGLRAWAGVDPHGVLAAVPTAIAFGLGVQLLVFAAADLDYQRWGRPIGYAITVILTLVTLALLFQTRSTWFPRLNSDVLAFTSWSVQLVAEGHNPFTASMAPSEMLKGTPDQWTYRTDGSRVVDWSYPGGTLWAYLPQFLLIGRGPIGLRLTSVLGVGALSGLLVWALPSQYAALGPASLVLPQNQWLAAAGGLNDMWWAIFAAGALILWAREQTVAAAAVFGVSAAMKQQPWVIALFLAIWVWKTSPSVSVFGRRAAMLIGAGGATFGLLNLPWMVQSPAAWLSTMVVPLGIGDAAPLLSRGVGLAALNMAADRTLVAREVFEMFIYVSVLVTAVGFWRFTDRFRWAAWLAPAVIFLFTPRSLPSYFLWFFPIAILSIMAAHGRIRGQTTTEVLAA